jgi:cob(I)alamin adenosyltransferase
MKIYTRQGDKGRTSLIGGKFVSKSHIRIEAYGSLDELMAHMGLLMDMTSDPNIKQELLTAEDRLMICAAILATDCDDCDTHIPDLPESSVSDLEKAIDVMEVQLPALKSFILPGGHIISSQCHVCRTICRRAERQIIRLSEELFVPDVVIKFVNRLSDYLFVLSRKVLHDFNKEDILWRPKL